MTDIMKKSCGLTVWLVILSLKFVKYCLKIVSFCAIELGLISK